MTWIFYGPFEDSTRKRSKLNDGLNERRTDGVTILNSQPELFHSGNKIWRTKLVINSDLWNAVSFESVSCIDVAHVANLLQACKDLLNGTKHWKFRQQKVSVLRKSFIAEWGVSVPNSLKNWYAIHLEYSSQYHWLKKAFWTHKCSTKIDKSYNK